MASIALSRNKNDVNETTAQIKTTLSGFSLPSNTATTKYTLNKQYYSVSSIPSNINWNVSGNTINISGLNKGENYDITISYTIEYTIDYYRWESSEDGIGGSYIWVNKESKTRSASDIIDIYTHPGAWHWLDYISKNDIIEKKLTHTLVNQWVDHLAAWKSWDTQKDQNSAYDDYYNPNNGTGYRVNSEDIIYLQWFNNCARAHPRASTISHNNNEDIISVDRFSTLDFNGT